ncbi:MAG: hypothetical protein ACYCRD_09545 [Leptospirillum sp.]
MKAEIGIDLSNHDVVPMLLDNQEEIRRLISRNVPFSLKQQIAVKELPFRLTYEVIIPARLWLTNEARKKGIKKYRELLKEAIDHRETFSLPYIAGDGTRRTEYPLRTLFPDSQENQLGVMIAKCDEILGEGKSARYPRQKIIRDTLKFWQEYGQPIPPTASIPRNRARNRTAIHPTTPIPRDRDQERNRTAIPYQLCKLVLTAIEGKTPGEFYDIYNKIAGSKTFQK